MTPAELEELDHLLMAEPPPPGGVEWMAWALPHVSLAPPGPRHVNLWSWAESVERGVRPRPFVGIWPRGSGKSTTAELVACYLGVTGRRRYVWYVSGNQNLADQHVDSVAGVLEGSRFAHAYPDFSARKLGKYGASKGWRRNRLRCASGFTVDALGLDVGVRGMKVEEQRPDLIVLDDVDDQYAEPAAVEKTVRKITGSVLPAGSGDCAVLAIQNLVHPNGFFARMAGGRADYLHDRVMDGPHPAVLDMVVRDGESGGKVIVGGTPTWAGQDLATCQLQMNTWGYSAFVREAQHDLGVSSMFGGVSFFRERREEVGDLVRVVVVVDPAVTSTDHSDSHGIAVAGLDEDDVVHFLHGVERVMSPYDSVREAVMLCLAYGARELHLESNAGGEAWSYVFDNVVRDLRDAGELDWAPTYFDFKATAATGGKVERAQTLLADYERPGHRVRHVLGTHGVLEEALLRFPESKPYDLVDAAVHAHRILRGGYTGLLI